jgi:hypothetical protein
VEFNLPNVALVNIPSRFQIIYLWIFDQVRGAAKFYNFFIKFGEKRRKICTQSAGPMPMSKASPFFFINQLDVLSFLKMYQKKIEDTNKKRNLLLTSFKIIRKIYKI